ncbi:MAG: MmcQ/YjbR family DNA-binding protein [Flavobacteriales bacterium]|nr:MmcQ/YjbR family DNA-binding protein [Flavobacteriales bacterium]MCB9168448.1 MmcQ/YjbR family DNA-binding protein [Flavobacteriales bacterium]
MDIEAARRIALSHPNTEEYPHFDKIGFRTGARSTGGKPGRTFMTLWVEDHRAVLLLTVEQQADLHARHPKVFFPVPNKWGDKGATFVELAEAREALFREALRSALAHAGRQ